MGKDLFAIALTLVSRAFTALGGLVLSILIARSFGAESLGQFTVFLSLLGFLAILAKYGLDVIIIRAVAWAESGLSSTASNFLLQWGVLKVVVPAVCLGVIGSALLFSGALGKPFPGTVVLMPVALTALTVLALVAGYYKGKSLSWIAPLFEIGGISILTSIYFLVFLSLSTAPDQTYLSWAFFAANLSLILAASSKFLSDSSSGMIVSRGERDRPHELDAGRFEFTIIALAGYLTQAGSFLLAAPFLNESDIGLLRSAERFALLVSFPVLAITPVISPRIAKLSRIGSQGELSRLIKGSLLISGSMSLILLGVLFLWSEDALALLGDEFVPARLYLWVIASAHFLIAFIGPLTALLNMAGHERVSMRISSMTLILMLFLVPLMCVYFGGVGFVIAYLFVVVCRLALIVLGIILVNRNTVAHMSR